MLRWVVRTSQNCFITRSVIPWSAVLIGDAQQSCVHISVRCWKIVRLWQQTPSSSAEIYLPQKWNWCWWWPQATVFDSAPRLLQLSIVPSFLPQVDEGGRAPLSLHHFFATEDQDNLQDDAVIKLSALPKYGCIENTGTGNPCGFAGPLFRIWKWRGGEIF